jgi:predicted enzyme related to lactoylglutathione lyase
MYGRRDAKKRKEKRGEKSRHRGVAGAAYGGGGLESEASTTTASPHKEYPMSVTARFGFPLEYVTDIPSVKRFFVDVLGLEIDRDHPTFVQFKARAGASYALASDERMAASDAPELWWVVDDARQAFAEMSAKAEVSMPLRELPFGTCFGLKDPAGQIHYVLEFAQTRPSQPVA